MSEYVTIKLYAETRRLLRLIAAQSGEQMVQVMQRLCADEWERVGVDPASVEAYKASPRKPGSKPKGGKE